MFVLFIAAGGSRREKRPDSVPVTRILSANVSVPVEQREEFDQPFTPLQQVLLGIIGVAIDSTFQSALLSDLRNYPCANVHVTKSLRR
jgi:hypothetical protein